MKNMNIYMNIYIYIHVYIYKYISQFPNKGRKLKKPHAEWGYRGLRLNLSQAPEQHPLHSEMLFWHVPQT